MMRITSLGAGGEVGRSAFLLEEEGKRVLFDYGIKIFGKDSKPRYPLPFTNPPNIALISHAHLDHIGHLPSLYKSSKIPWYSTPPTVDIAEVLWKDTIKLAKLKFQEQPFTQSNIEKAKFHWHPALYNQKITYDGLSFSFYDAGHIMGSASILVELKGKRILYSGDYKDSPTQLHKGLKHPGEVDVLLTEATYWNKDHPTRKEAEKQLIDTIRDIVESGGTAIIAAFALGRTQELIQVVRSYIKDIPVYVDGMGKQITKIYLKYPGYIRDFMKFKESVESVRMVESGKDRKKAIKEGNIIITTAGMLEGGPVLNYILNAPSNSGIILTGYQVEGTNGRRLLDEGKLIVDEYELSVDLPVTFIDFSAHAGRSEIISYVKRANPEIVIVEHVDDGDEFAEELKNLGFNALPIKTGQTFEF